jgi:hypothetical protein
LGTCGVARCGLIEHWAKAAPGGKEASLTAADLPHGSAPKAVPIPHFPDRLHAFVWRNWQLVPARRMGEVVGAGAGDIVRMGRRMGLAGPPRITVEQQRRSALSVIRRNWHLLPYDQLLQLLGWTADQMAFSLREDDFLFVKLGNLKPQCEPLRYSPPDAGTQARARAIADVLRAEFPSGVGEPEQPLFQFVKDLSRLPKTAAAHPAGASAFSPRYCYSFFALYGDPLLDPTLDPYPDGYLARLADSGVSGVWLQAVLTRLAPFPWDTRQSEGHETRLKNLRLLVERAQRHSVKRAACMRDELLCHAAESQRSGGRRFRGAVYERAGGARMAGDGRGDHLPLCAGAGGFLHYHRLGEPDELLVAWQRQSVSALRQARTGRGDRRGQFDLLRGHPARGQRADVDRLGLGLA